MLVANLGTNEPPMFLGLMKVNESNLTFPNISVLVVYDGSNMSFSRAHISTATLTPCIAFHPMLFTRLTVYQGVRVTLSAVASKKKAQSTYAGSINYTIHYSYIFFISKIPQLP